MMEVKHLSASSIKTFKYCEFKFFLEQILRISMKETYAANLGTFMHTVFEKFANKELDIETWADWANEHYSELKDVAKTHKDFIGFSDEKILTAILSDVHRLFNLVFNRKPEFNPLVGGEIIAAEKEFREDLGNGVFIKGFIDLVLKFDENIIQIYDWKSGKYSLSQKDAQKDPQVLIYSLAGRILYPEYSNFVTLDYIQKWPIHVAANDQTIKATKKAIFRYWDKIRAITKPRRHENPIWVCRSFCERKKCDCLWAKFQKGCSLEEMKNNA